MAPSRRCRPGALQAYKLIFPAHIPAGEPELQVHEGNEWLYVLSGRLRHLLGEHDLILTAGEAVEFDTLVRALTRQSGPQPAEVLSLFGPQGERLHVRARPSPGGR